MPGFLLHQGATVQCQHGGSASAMAVSPRVNVAGRPAVPQPSPWSVAGCPFTTGGSPQPCVTAQWTTAATRVRSDGQPLLLQDSQATCAPNGTGVSAVSTQQRARAT